MSNIKEYSNGEVTVTWEPEKCIHSGICVKGLATVFKPKEKPWVKIGGASTQEIVEQVKQCPSGALGFYMNSDADKKVEQMETKIDVIENGPLLVYGTLKVTHKDGREETKSRSTAFCRCGMSNNKPFCDGTHKKENFVG